MARRFAAEIVRANEALVSGRWGLARACFEKALRIRETAQALEGLGMAAWWLGDSATVFDARERAYRLYRRQGDRRGAGRVAIAVAEDYLQFRGEAAVAGGWHRRAGRLLSGLERIPEHGWLKVWQGDLALTRGDDPARVRKLAAQGVAIGRELGDVNLEMAALALEGLGRVLAGGLSEGILRLDEATTAAVSGEMTDRVAIGLSCCYLVTACEHIRDFTRAAQWCQHLREFCERTGFTFLLAVCRTQYAGVLTWQGFWAEAERELQAVARDGGGGRPALRQEALLRLADLRRRQGRLAEAAALLKQVDEGHPLSSVSRATLALDQSDPAAAAHLAHRFLRRAAASNRTDRVGAVDVLLRASLALGQRAAARGCLEELRAIAVKVATEPVKATALIGEGLVAAADGNFDCARNAFEDAIDLLARSGGSFEAACCRVELARVLAALGESDAATTELQEARRGFEMLGADQYLADTTALLREQERGAHMRPDGGPPRGGLTRREIEVLRLVARGLSNPQIGKTLVVSEFTIKRHVANLLAKLDLPSRAAAAAYAAREGLT